jgi:putative oxygen-independent coproporphyrinogen III oxidase
MTLRFADPDAADTRRNEAEQLYLGRSAARQRELMLYIHVPFCPSKCHFCGWVQGIPKRELLLRPDHGLRQNYIHALCREIRERAVQLSGAQYIPNIVYWGGGTGTSLTETEIETVHAALADSFALSSVIEATIEGSPDTISPSKLALIHNLGYQRVSFGIQSFDDRRLRHIGRVHSPDDARKAVEWAAAIGFKDINIDLMCGFPNESINEVDRTVREAVRLPVTHISFYPYRPTQDSVMRNQLARGSGLLDANYQKAAYALGRCLIEEAGFPEYAMSYFGSVSLNDLAIFRVQQDWLGFGSGAHSLIGGTCHIHKRGRLGAYIDDPMAWDQSVPAYLPQIALMLLGQGLSTFKGIERNDWLERTGQSLDETLCQPAVQGYVDWFRRRVGVIEDTLGIRLQREAMAEAFIDMLLGMHS